MIDAATFAVSYNAFWQAFTPTCEHFVRWVNMNGLERFSRPMPPSTTHKRRAVIAEYAFSLFAERRKYVMAPRSIGASIEETAWEATEVRLRPYAAQGLDLHRRFDQEESREVDDISAKLHLFFSNTVQPFVLRPIYAGCGFVDASEGDVLAGDTIYEIKTVERPFRSSDIRQTIAYAALNFASGQYVVRNIGLFNPRRGQSFSMTLEDVAAEISGRPAQSLLASIVDAISSGEISR